MKPILFFLTTLMIFSVGCITRKMPSETVYDLPPTLFPLKVVAMREWGAGRNIYTFEDPHHNSISRVYKADPSLKIGKVITLEDIK